MSLGTSNVEVEILFEKNIDDLKLNFRGVFVSNHIVISIMIL